MERLFLKFVQVCKKTSFANPDLTRTKTRAGVWNFRATTFSGFFCDFDVVGRREERMLRTGSCSRDYEVKKEMTSNFAGYKDPWWEAKTAFHPYCYYGDGDWSYCKSWLNIYLIEFKSSEVFVFKGTVLILFLLLLNLAKVRFFLLSLCDTELTCN